MINKHGEDICPKCGGEADWIMGDLICNGCSLNSKECDCETEKALHG